MTQASRARRPVRRGNRDQTGPPGPGGRYGLLLLLVLTATYLLSAFSVQRVTATVQVGLVAAVLGASVARLVAAYRSPAEPKNEPRNPPPSRFPPRGVRNGTRRINGTIPLGSTRRSLHQRPAYRRRVDGS
jgi:hypothetical protein